MDFMREHPMWIICVVAVMAVLVVTHVRRSR